MKKLNDTLSNSKSVARHKWELLKYERREAARARKRFPITWRTHFGLIWDDLKLLHEVEPEKYDEKFLEKNIQAYETVKKSNLKVGLGLIGIISFLILSTFEMEFPISVYGIRLTAAPRLNEFLIILVSVVSALTAGKLIYLFTLITSIKRLTPLIYKDGLTYFYGLNSLIDDFPIYYRPCMSPQIVWTRSMSLVSIFVLLLSFVKIIAVLGASIAWRYFVYLEIWTNPSLSAEFGKIAVSISMLIDATTLVFLVFYIAPLPHRDYSVNHKLEIAEQLGKKAKERAYRDVFGDDWDDENDMIEKGYISKKE